MKCLCEPLWKGLMMRHFGNEVVGGVAGKVAVATAFIVRCGVLVRFRRGIFF